jgi:hypothetical protein
MSSGRAVRSLVAVLAAAHLAGATDTRGAVADLEAGRQLARRGD